MKQIVKIAVFMLFFGLLPANTSAQSACGPSNGGNYACPSGQTCKVISGSGGQSAGTCESIGTPDTMPSGFVPVVSIPNLTEGILPTETGLALFLNNLYKYLVGIAAILAVVQIMRAGLLITVQSDSVSMHSEGVKMIKQALGGLVLVLSPALVFSVINPSILNLSLNIPALDTATKPLAPRPAPQQTQSSGLKSYSKTCTSADCGKEIAECYSKSGVSSASSHVVTCMRTDGSIDAGGRSDSWYSRSYACVSGQTPAVVCNYDLSPTIAP